MTNNTINNCPIEKNSNIVDVMPFEFFYLGELLAEGIIDQALFNKAYEKLSKEINLNKKENELEELEL